MTNDIDSLKAGIRRWTLVLGVLQITVGCLIGFIPPSAVEWFRGIDSPIVTGLLQLCGVTIMTALLLTLVGLLRNRNV
jgi:hypothetical protein